MNPIEHYKGEKEKMNQIREAAAIERQRRLDAVEAYLKGQEEGGLSRKEIMRNYFKKYYQDFLDNPLAETMNKKKRYDLLKEIIYCHEILHEAGEKKGARKAA